MMMTMTMIMTTESTSQLYVPRGQSTSLTCPLETTTCGELHSITWFKGGTERIAVASGDGKFTQVEGTFSDRYVVKCEKKKRGRVCVCVWFG